MDMTDSNKYCLIMAGGLGRRFWPCSRRAMPKQFLDFFGMGKSLLRMTYERYRRVVPEENIYVTTHVDYQDIVLEQLPEMHESQLIVESERRNTAPAIAHASHVIGLKDPNAVMIVAPCDHLVLREESFDAAMRRSMDFAMRNDKLLTHGIRPTRPETGYGYLQVSEEDAQDPGFYKVKAFIEKPTREFAEIFVRGEEFFWNSGIFVWSLQAIDKALHTYMADIKAYTNRDEPDFMSCPNISIDYCLMEKADNVYVQICDFGWADLGSWESLYEATPKDRSGNVVMGSNTLLYDCKDSIISLPKGQLAVIQGLEGYLVAQHDDVLVICPKNDDAAMRKFVNDVEMRFGQRFS